MAEGALQAWIGSRDPGPPDPFLPLLLREEGGGSADALDLATLGESALRRALDTPGRVRAAAFDLLVADAFLTWACEAMAREEDVAAGLESLVQGLGERFAP